MIKTFHILITILIPMIFSNTEAQETGIVKRDLYQFTIPQGWVGQNLDGNYILGSHSEPGMILLVENNHRNLAALIKEVKNDLTDNYSYRFNLTGDIQRSDNMFSSDFNGLLGGEQARGHLVGLVDSAMGGILIIAITTPDKYTKRYAELASQIASSLSFSTLTKPLADDDKSIRDNDLLRKYSDVKLTYMESYYSSGYTGGSVSGGYSDREEISLCSSGYFTFNSSYESSAGSNSSSMYGDMARSKYIRLAKSGQLSWRKRSSRGQIESKRYSLLESQCGSNK